MAKLIGSAQSTNFGENLFIRKAQEFLDDQYIIYWNRQIYGREFDVCILMPGKGILVVELKGWREEIILRIEHSDTIIIRTNEGNVPATPQKAKPSAVAKKRRSQSNFSAIAKFLHENLLFATEIDITPAVAPKITHYPCYFPQYPGS